MRMTALLSLLVAAGCGGVTAESPLTVSLGGSRDETVSKLEKNHRYCPKPGDSQGKIETYPRCERPGAEWGESWIVARYTEGKLSELRRYERFTDEGRATERWNQLVLERMKLNPEDPEALREIQDTRLEPGTKSVKAFRIDAGTVVAVYLMTPTPPDDASILEAILPIAKR